MPIDPPTPNQPIKKLGSSLNWGSAGAMAGGLLWIVALGCQAAVTNHPEYLGSLVSAADLAHYGSVLTLIVSAFMQHGATKTADQKANDAHAALEVAKAQPPVGPDGKPSALLGLCAAMQSAVDEEKFDLAKDLLELREKHGA